MKIFNGKTVDYCMVFYPIQLNLHLFHFALMHNQIITLLTKMTLVIMQIKHFIEIVFTHTSWMLYITVLKLKLLAQDTRKILSNWLSLNRNSEPRCLQSWLSQKYNDGIKDPDYFSFCFGIRVPALPSVWLLS